MQRAAVDCAETIKKRGWKNIFFISDTWKPEIIELETLKFWRGYAVFEARFAYPNSKLTAEDFLKHGSTDLLSKRIVKILLLVVIINERTQKESHRSITIKKEK